MSVTHVAGPVIGINGRGIQRCMVCGEKLGDTLNQMAPVNPDGSAPVMLSWRAGALVSFDGNRQSDEGLFEAAEGLPDDFCLALVE
jgi:hypothetical protein